MALSMQLVLSFLLGQFAVSDNAALSLLQTDVVSASFSRASRVSPVPLESGSAVGFQRNFTVARKVAPLEDDVDADIAATLLQQSSHLRAPVSDGDRAQDSAAGSPVNSRPRRTTAGRLGMQVSVSRSQVVLPKEPEDEEDADIASSLVQQTIHIKTPTSDVGIPVIAADLPASQLHGSTAGRMGLQASVSRGTVVLPDEPEAVSLVGKDGKKLLVPQNARGEEDEDSEIALSLLQQTARAKMPPSDGFNVKAVTAGAPTSKVLGSTAGRSGLQTSVSRGTVVLPDEPEDEEEEDSDVFTFGLQRSFHVSRHHA